MFFNKNILKSINFFIIIFTQIIYLSISHSETQKLNHVVFLIHGLQGDITTFCELDQAIKDEFKN